MVYCLWSTAAIISADGITTTTKKVGFGVYLFYFFLRKGEKERERERNALETIFILADFSLLA